MRTLLSRNAGLRCPGCGAGQSIFAAPLTAQARAPYGEKRCNDGPVRCPRGSAPRYFGAERLRTAAYLLALPLAILTPLLIGPLIPRVTKRLETV